MGEYVQISHKAYTYDEILFRFTNYIQRQKPGLERFYKLGESNQLLKDAVVRGMDMTEKLMDYGCPPEESAALSVLALWDLVVLIDNSVSMGMEENGARVKTLTDTLKHTAMVYSFGSTGGGISTVRFLNTSRTYTDIGPKKIDALMKRVAYEGLTTIGTKLKNSVLREHVTPNMKKPLLVLILSDAEISGESSGLISDVIMSQVVALQKKYPPHGADAVAYQFAKIGNDETGTSLVAGLDDHERIGRYIDSIGPEYRLEDMKADKWRILPKLLLGAISPWWDTENANSNEELEGKDDEFVQSDEDSGDLTEGEFEDDFFVPVTRAPPGGDNTSHVPKNGWLEGGEIKDDDESGCHGKPVPIAAPEPITKPTPGCHDGNGCDDEPIPEPITNPAPGCHDGSGCDGEPIPAAPEPTLEPTPEPTPGCHDEPIPVAAPEPTLEPTPGCHDGGETGDAPEPVSEPIADDPGCYDGGWTGDVPERENGSGSDDGSSSSDGSGSSDDEGKKKHKKNKRGNKRRFNRRGECS